MGKRIAWTEQTKAHVRAIDQSTALRIRHVLAREYHELEDEDIRQALDFAAALVDHKVLPLPPAR
jgi:uncharacterized protein (DUF433 family)